MIETMLDLKKIYLVLKKNCYSIISYDQFEKKLLKKKIKKKITIIYIKNYLINGFGIDWLKTFIKLINTKY